MHVITYLRINHRKKIAKETTGKITGPQNMKKE
jgi:hypothetical protein